MADQALTAAALATGKSLLGNPWQTAEWNLTVQGRFIEKYGVKAATQFAKVAGNPLYGGMLKREVGKPLTVIYQRNITTGGGGGSSGEGPPS